MKLLFFVWMFFSAQVSFGQLKLETSTLVRANSDTLFIGVKNRINVKGLRYEPSLELKSKTAEIIREKNKNSFDVYVKTITTDTFKLYSKGKVIFTKIYFVRRLCDPVIIFGDGISDLKSISEIVNNPNLSFQVPCGYKAFATVRNFDYSIVQKNKDTLNLGTVIGSSLTTDKLDLIRNLNTGDQIILKDIVAVGNQFCPRTFMAPIVLTIK